LDFIKCNLPVATDHPYCTDIPQLSHCLCFRYESKGKQFAKNQPKYPVGFSPEVVNATKSKKEKTDKVASQNSPIPGLVIVSTAEGIHFFLFGT
jgi:ribosomal protein L39E